MLVSDLGQGAGRVADLGRLRSAVSAAALERDEAEAAVRQAKAASRKARARLKRLVVELRRAEGR